jgi:two-component system alkaline phosphatase synthesis response regulator PhoP
MARARVLVVDDDRAIVTVLQAALEDEGYEVLTAVNGGALPIARQQQPHLILLDIMMPGMDGVEVSRQLRADPATERIPIVAMSAATTLARLADQMPIDDRLAKPFDIDAIYGLVARWTEPR